MDNITHTFTGLMLARAGLTSFASAQMTGKYEAKAHAKANARLWGIPVMLMLSANVPDIDMISIVRGPLATLQVHRGYTHALLFLPIMALIPLFFVRLTAGVRVTWKTYLASFVAVLSHPLLDWTNVYGIRMLMPFSDRWLRLDMTDLFDPWIYLIFFSAMAAPALSGLVNSEIASRKVAAPTRRWAQVALAVLLLYEGGRWVMHQRAVNVLSAHVYGENGVPKRVTAAPSRASIWRWRGIVEGDRFVDIVPMDLSGEFDAGPGRIYYPAEPSANLELARQTEVFQIFGNFNQVPFWKESPLPDGGPGSSEVQLIDLRFGSPDRPGFEAVAEADQGRIRDARFTFGPQSPR